jgi:hypothetical protein
VRLVKVVKVDDSPRLQQDVRAEVGNDRNSLKSKRTHRHFELLSIDSSGATRGTSIAEEGAG